MKFGMVTHIGIQGIDSKSFEFLKIQDGGWPPSGKPLNCDMYEIICPIWTKFGPVTQMYICYTGSNRESESNGGKSWAK